MPASATIYRYVHLHNEGVSSGDFRAMLPLFFDDAVLVFASIPFGPFYGRDAIAAAFAAHPPNDHLVIIDSQETHDGVRASYAWNAQPARLAGTLEATIRDGRIARMVIVFHA